MPGKARSGDFRNSRRQRRKMFRSTSHNRASSAIWEPASRRLSAANLNSRENLLREAATSHNLRFKQFRFPYGLTVDQDQANP
jgi:hypothetical protein